MSVNKSALFLMFLSSMGAFAQGVPKPMTEIPSGMYSGKVYSLEANGEKKEVSTITLAGRDKVLYSHSESADGLEGTGFEGFRFMADGHCEVDSMMAAFAPKGTCTDNIISLKLETPGASNGRTIYETRYQWDADVIHYSYVETKIRMEDGKEIRSQSIIQGDLAKVK